MPTVPLGESTAGANMLANLGFTGVPNGADPPRAINAHLAEPGGTVLKTEKLDEKETQASIDLAAALPKGLLGGPLVAEQGQVVGFLVPEADSGPPPATPGRLVDVGAIREVLAAEGITPRQGPVDTSFEAAMHAFKNGGFAASIPNLKATLTLFPGHAMATANLAVAEQNVAAGTPGPADAGGTTAEGPAGADGGISWVGWLLLLAAALLLAGIVAFLLRRRSRASSSGGDTAPPRTPPAGKSQPAAASRTPGPATGSRSVVPPGGPGGTGRGGPNSPGRGAPALSGSTRSGPGRSASVVGQGPAATVADPDRRPSRATAAPAAPSPSARDVPVGTEQPAFCTSCGAQLAVGHLYCGRCGAAR
jgi:hypothetical protein